MEFYLRYAESLDHGDCSCTNPRCKSRCQSHKHVPALLACAYPEVSITSSTACAEHDNRKDKMFFSKWKLQDYFRPPKDDRKLGVIEELLSCQCHLCKEGRKVVLEFDDQPMLEAIEASSSYQLVLAILVYLQKLHFVYTWFISDYRKRDFRVAMSQLCHPRSLDVLIKDDKERGLFNQVCEQAVELFDPVELDFSGSLSSPMQCRDYRRFPFLAETPIGEGSFGTITKFEIAPGYCDKAEKVLMRDYHRSAVGHGNEKKLLFAAKSVKDSDPNSHALVLDELRVLRLVSKLDNVITLLACYTWREKTYFVFPYVETDLEELLTDKINIEGKKPLTLQSSKELPHHWLWKEMVGVTNALKHIHGGIKDPSERTSGDVIGFHSDLKPANILVTANGKLKIGDFGLSYIQIMKTGDVFEAEYQGGEVRYAAPESKLSPDERGELLRPRTNDPAPVLKLDIWSLACIMTEVLVRLVNPKGKESPLKHFRDELVQCQEGGGYEQRSFDKEGVKQCVKDTIDALKAKGSARSAIGQYLSSIAELLLAMFQHDNSSRLSSQEVLLKLQNAKEEYRGNLRLDGPGWELKEQSPPEDQNLWEVGWINKNNRLVSFSKMEGIELEAVKQVDGNPQLKRKCRFRLFERRPSPERERPSHESERSGHTAVPTFVLKYAVEEGPESKAYEEDINLSDWAFKPTYLFQKLPGSKPRYECLLFLVKRTSSSKALVFTFASIKDLNAFQGALLQKEIFSDLEFSDATVKFDVYGSPRVDTLDSASVQFWSSIQPKYLPRTGRGPPEPLSQKDETMVIFCPKKSLLKIPLNDGKKDFRLAKREQDKVQISHKEKSGHRYFDVFEFKYQPCDPWDKKTGESETKFTTPELQLQHESDKTLVKVKEMTIATTGRSSQGAQNGDIEKLKLATGMKTRKNRR